MTNEHFKSKTWIYYYEPVAPAKKSILSNGEKRLVANNGSLVCSNPACAAVSQGYTTKSRDTLAAYAIALAGASQMVTGQTLLLFDPQVLQDEN